MHGGGRARARPAPTGRSDGCALSEGRAQALLLLVVERRLDYVAAEGLQALEQLVRRLAGAERDQRGGAGLELGSELLEEVVVDAGVGDLAGDRAGGGADGHAEQRGQEQQPDQAAPQRTAGRARAGRADRLVELDLAVGLVLDDDR